MIVQARAQVLMGVLSPSPAITFLYSFGSTYGPFFSDLPIIRFVYLLVSGRNGLSTDYFFLRFLTMFLLDSFLGERVLPPFDSTPVGEQGCRPPALRPSPPPIGWATGFMAEPRTVGRIPRQRFLPALPILMF